jgi:hypothetical protein
MISICHCGNVETNHEFKHAFTAVDTCIISKTDNITTIRMDANNFPVKTKEKCSVANCNLPQKLHNYKINTPNLFIKKPTEYTILGEHEYIPQILFYREIKLTIPDDIQCNTCKLTLKTHKNIEKENHNFRIKVEVLNIKNTDKIFITDRDDEQKIDWN